jgi:hypothetical protein
MDKKISFNYQLSTINYQLSFESRVMKMPIIRLMDGFEVEAWKVLLESGTVNRIPPKGDKLYAVTQKQVDLLKTKGLPFEEIKPNASTTSSKV